MNVTKKCLVSWELGYRQFYLHWLHIHSHSGTFFQESRTCVSLIRLNTDAGVCHWKGCRWCATEQIGYTHFDIAVTVMRHMTQTYRVKLSTLWNDFLLFLTSACHLLSVPFTKNPSHSDLRHNAVFFSLRSEQLCFISVTAKALLYSARHFDCLAIRGSVEEYEIYPQDILKELLRNTQNVNKIDRRTLR
jgi:hypothetical protein